MIQTSVNDSLPYYAEAQGAKVVIHEPGSMPLPAEEAKSVATGFNTEFGLSLVSAFLFDVAAAAVRPFSHVFL